MEKLMKKQKTKQTERGITLIALVVTIIVLLILAGVSIQMLTGQTGILTQTQQARENTRGGEVKDAVALAVAENELAKNTGKGTVRKKEDVVKELAQDGKLTAEEVAELEESDKLTIGSIDIDFSKLEGETAGGTPGNPGEDGIFTKNSTIDGTTGSYDNPTIPAEFKPVNPSEDSTVGQADWGDGKSAPSQDAVNAGLVIEDKDKNQFVWVPVPKAIAGSVVSGTATQVDLEGFDSETTPMAEPVEVVEESKTNYRGVLYQDWDVSVGKVTNIQYSSTGYREPATVSSDSTNEMTDNLQAEYNKMVTSVSTYGGFYVARYEMSLSEDGKAQYKEGQPSADASKGSANMWYGLYKKQKEFATKYSESKVNSTIKSSMIWGSQYDAMMNWMARCGINIGGGDSNLTGKAYNNTQTTGVSGDTDVLNNIYDLIGCQYEWTLEASSTSYRTYRGGKYTYGYSPSNRFDSRPTFTTSYYGSRASLYL